MISCLQLVIGSLNRALRESERSKAQSYLMEAWKQMQELILETEDATMKIVFKNWASDLWKLMNVKSDQRKERKETLKFQFEDVVGLEEEILKLKEAVILPRLLPQLFSHGRKPFQTVLLYGSPGTGKTFLAYALAQEAAIENFINVSSGDLLSEWCGQTEKKIKSLFDQAKEHAPSLIFFDEIDGFCCERSNRDSDITRRLKTEFLKQMQYFEDHDLTIIAATNRPWDLDKAILRRFSLQLYVQLPSRESRYQLFHKAFFQSGIKHELKESDLMKLAEDTDGCTPSDIQTLIQHAISEPINQLQKAEYFIKNEHGKWEISSSDEPTSKEMSLMEFSSQHEIEIPAVTLQCFSNFPIAPTNPQKKFLRWKQLTEKSQSY